MVTHIARVWINRVRLPILAYIYTDIFVLSLGYEDSSTNPN